MSLGDLDLKVMAMVLMIVMKMETTTLMMVVTVYDSSWRTLLLKNWPELEARRPTGMSKSLKSKVKTEIILKREKKETEMNENKDCDIEDKNLSILSTAPGAGSQ